MEAGDRASTAAEALSELAAASPVRLSPSQLEQFGTYISILLLWRARLSLTGASSARGIVRFHVLDSLAVAQLVEPGFRVADLGSGAGFPGIPLAIACPQASVVLVEAKRKKANFLREVIRKVRLPNATVCEQRAESATADVGGCDVVVSRAVWRGTEFLDIAQRLLRGDGRAVAMKGPAALRENWPMVPGFAAPEMVAYHLHGGAQRFLVIFRRVNVSR